VNQCHALTHAKSNNSSIDCFAFGLARLQLLPCSVPYYTYFIKFVFPWDACQTEAT